MILVTGSAGLIGRHLCVRLTSAGIAFRRFDIGHSPEQDICNRQSLEEALKDVTGVVHLAAVSRVIWGERDPANCLRTNVTAVESLVDLSASGSRPWIVFASSREVYGIADRLPVQEQARLRPINVYGRSKRVGEALIGAARKWGVLTNVCRFSNVFGCPRDHPDRVVMAFAAVAARGGAMSIEGSRSMFDFTAVEDAVDGLYRLVQATMEGEALPPIHFVSGRGTTLRNLAEIAAAHSMQELRLEESAQRDFDVPAFVGDPSRAFRLLGWQPRAILEGRVGQLVSELAREGPTRTSAKGLASGLSVA